MSVCHSLSESVCGRRVGSMPACWRIASTVSRESFSPDGGRQFLSVLRRVLRREANVILVMVEKSLRLVISGLL